MPRGLCLGSLQSMLLSKRRVLAVLHMNKALAMSLSCDVKTKLCLASSLGGQLINDHTFGAHLI